MSIVWIQLPVWAMLPPLTARRCTANLPIQDSFLCHQSTDGPCHSVFLASFLRLQSRLMANMRNTLSIRWRWNKQRPSAALDRPLCPLLGTWRPRGSLVELMPEGVLGLSLWVDWFMFSFDPGRLDVTLHNLIVWKWNRLPWKPTKTYFAAELCWVTLKFYWRPSAWKSNNDCPTFNEITSFSKLFVFLFSRTRQECLCMNCRLWPYWLAFMQLIYPTSRWRGGSAEWFFTPDTTPSPM